MSAFVRTKSPPSLHEGWPSRTLPALGSLALLDRAGGPVGVKTIGRDHGGTRVSEPLYIEIPVVPDVIALALAQLVRDAWAAERREHDDGQGRLRVMVTGSSR